MKENYTHIAAILDRSGSMRTVASDTIGGFNTFLAEQKAIPGESTFTLVQFDDQYERPIDFISLQNVPELNHSSFQPRGWTALHDAIGRTIIHEGARLSLMQEKDRPSRVMIIIITDGKENASKEFTANQIRGMITEQKQKYSWEFVFLGANQDAILTGESLGISLGDSLTYAHDPQGVRSAFCSVSDKLGNFRGTGDNVAFSATDREAQNR